MTKRALSPARRGLPILAALVLVTAAKTATAPPAIEWRLIPEYDRALPDHPLPSESEAHLYAARGEYQAFQVAVPAPRSGLQLLDATSSDLTEGRDRCITAASSVTIYREHYVHIDPASPDRHGSNRSLGAGWYPDALIPFRNPKTGKPPDGQYRAAPYRFSGSDILTVWVDVFVPRDAKPGDYSAKLTLAFDHEKIEVPWKLTVWAFDLPVKPTLRSSFAFWNAAGPDEIQELLRHKLMPQHGAGKEGAAAERKLGSTLGLSMTDAGFWSGADNSHCSMKPAPPVKDLLAAVASHDPDLWLFNYTADEVGNCRNLYPAIQSWARNLHAAHIRNLVVMAPTPELMDDGTGHPAVDIWVMLPFQFAHSAALIASARAHGDEIWSYNALVQDSYSPKWLIDYDPIDYRLQAGFLSQTMGLTGLLYWRIDRWDGDVWKNVNNQGAFSSGNFPGDGLLVYPGAPAGVPGVVPSIRLNQLREGVQDYEYVAILKRLGRGDWALDKIHPIAPDWTKWTRSGASLESVRRELGAEIERLSEARH